MHLHVSTLFTCAMCDDVCVLVHICVKGVCSHPLLKSMESTKGCVPTVLYGSQVRAGSSIEGNPRL